MISIIIPVYNVKLYLDKCLQSVANQYFRDWECILVDDGSTDGSSLICDKWENSDSRFVTVHQANAGVSNARNVGIEIARGEFITFIDSDDWVDENYLSTLINHDADLIVCGLVKEYNSKQEIMQPSFSTTFPVNPKNVVSFTDLNKKSLLYGPMGKLYKTSIVDNERIRFPQGISYGEDLLFNYSYLQFVHTIAQVSASPYHYRISDRETLSTKKREEQFQEDYKQWQVLRSFHIDRGLWLTPAQDYHFQRLWGIVYDGIFNTRTSVKAILSIPEIDELMDFQSTFECSWWIKFCILHRITCIFDFLR